MPRSRLWLRHIAHTARRAADRHARLQVVDQVCDGRDEDEEDQDDQEDDDVALHDCGVCGGSRVMFVESLWKVSIWL